LLKGFTPPFAQVTEVMRPLAITTVRSPRVKVPETPDIELTTVMALLDVASAVFATWLALSAVDRATEEFKEAVVAKS
jgi:hypothetical protein